MAFVFVCSVFSENDVITDFKVVVSSMSIFTGVIFFSLRLILLTYEFLIHPMFYWQNHITAKYQLARNITFWTIGC